jgi:hypothetical protein
VHRFQGNLLLVSSALKMEAAGPSMTIIIYPTTQCHTSKDSHFMVLLVNFGIQRTVNSANDLGPYQQ